MIDRVATQVLYAVTGIVLARMLSQDDFGLVGAVLVFQSFATLLVDSGFSYALIQRKRPTKLDYSTILWFNIAVSLILYAILYVSAPLIAMCFQNDARIIPLSRVLFISLILNALSIIQTNRLTKAMTVKMIAVANSISLIIGGVVGIVLAVLGFGAWAIVWQTIANSGIKTIVLWTSSNWRPLWKFSFKSLRSYFSIGSKMMVTSFLSIIFQNIYSFLIGNRVNLTALGYYTQSDKWSKMPVASLSQVLTSTFLPPLSAVQDDPMRFRAIMSKINRFTAYILFPALLGLAAMATPIFHTLFGTKWDPSIILFQLLLIRGIFLILSALYNNYILALGHGSTLVKLEVFRDVTVIVTLVATLPFIALSTPESPVEGIIILLWGQLAANIVLGIVTLAATIRLTGLPLMRFIKDNLPYLAQTMLIIPIMVAAGYAVESDWLTLVIEVVVALTLYLGINHLLGSKIQKEAIAAILRR